MKEKSHLLPDEISRRRFLQIACTLGGFALAAHLGLAGCAFKEASPEKLGEAKEFGSLPADNKVTVTVGFLPITDHLTVIASSLYQFTKAEFKPVKFSSWSELAEALRAKAIDAAFALTPIGLELRAKGVPIKALLLGHRNGSVITVKKNAPIDSVQDLKGKTIAIPSRFSTHNILLRKVLSENNIDLNEVTVLEMAPPEMVQALASDQIHAFIVAEPFGAQAELLDIGRVLVLSKDIWPEHICCVLNVREELLEKNLEAVEELVSNLMKAGKFIEDNRAEAAAFSPQFLGQETEVIEHVLTNPYDRVTYRNLIPELEDFENTQRYLKDFDIVDNKVELEKYVERTLALKLSLTSQVKFKNLKA